MRPWGDVKRLDVDMVTEFRETFLNTENGRRVLVELGEQMGFFSDEILDGEEGRAHYVLQQQYKTILVCCGVWQPANAPWLVEGAQAGHGWKKRLADWFYRLRNKHSLQIEDEEGNHGLD